MDAGADFKFSYYTNFVPVEAYNPEALEKPGFPTGCLLRENDEMTEAQISAEKAVPPPVQNGFSLQFYPIRDINNIDNRLIAHETWRKKNKKL
ncbi:MAG: hypothetical protein AB1847_00470 [bacterium]